MKRTRNALTLCPEAATYVSVLHDELDKRLFNKTDTTKNWLMNDATQFWLRLSLHPAVGRC